MRDVRAAKLGFGADVVLDEVVGRRLGGPLGLLRGEDRRCEEQRAGGEAEEGGPLVLHGKVRG